MLEISPALVLRGGFLLEWVLPVDRNKSKLGEAAVAVPAAAAATLNVSLRNLVEEDWPTRLAKGGIEEEGFWREIALVGCPFAPRS